MPIDHIPAVGKRQRLASWLTGDGIEIGALHHPLPVPPTARVTYVDRFPEAVLRQHYPELSGEAFAPVTEIGNAHDLSAFPNGSLDFVIANHLVEHLEDPIRALTEFHRVLRRDGVLYMALPDARLTFDKDRELTSLDHLLTEYRNGTAPGRHAHYLDWAINVDKHPQPAEHAARLDEMDYSIHFHVFVPDTFLEFFLAAEREAGLDFELAAYAPPESPEDNEFILALLKGRSRSLRLAPAPPPTPVVNRWHQLRTRVAHSPAGPILRPLYRMFNRRWSVRHRTPTSGPAV